MTESPLETPRKKSRFEKTNDSCDSSEPPKLAPLPLGPGVLYAKSLGQSPKRLQIRKVGDGESDLRVDIRLWLPALKGPSYPSKKRGISLTVPEFMKLYRGREDLTQCLQEIVFDQDYNESLPMDAATQEAEEGKLRHWVQLSDLLQAETKSPYKCVNIRRWFTPMDNPDGDFRPGFGVTLNSYEWFQLWQGMDEWIDFLGEEAVGFGEASVGV